MTSPDSTVQPTALDRRGGSLPSVEEMLEARHTMRLGWVEPWLACGPEGNDLDAHLELRATVHDCINMQRAAVRQRGGDTMGNDARHLLDFMAVHWAAIVEANTQAQRPVGPLHRQFGSSEDEQSNLSSNP